MGIERRYIIQDLEPRPILRTSEQVWVVKKFADGNKWDPKLSRVRQVVGIGDHVIWDGGMIPIMSVPNKLNRVPVLGYILFDKDGGSLPSHKLGFSEPGLPEARWYVNSLPKTEELVRYLEWWNGNPPVKAIPGMWSSVTGVRILGKPISVDMLRAKLGE